MRIVRWFSMLVVFLAATATVPGSASAGESPIEAPVCVDGEAVQCEEETSKKCCASASWGTMCLIDFRKKVAQE